MYGTGEVSIYLTLTLYQLVEYAVYKPYAAAQMVGAFSQSGPWVSLFIGVKNGRPKPNLPKRKGIHPFRCLACVC